MSTLVSTTSGGQVRRCRKKYTFMYDRAFLLGHCPPPLSLSTAEWGVTRRTLACRCRHWIDIVRGSWNIVMCER